MLIRFLQNTPSGHPEYPFYAGQIIQVDAPPEWMLELLDGVRAVAVRDDEPERAVAVPTVKRRGRPRKVRA